MAYNDGHSVQHTRARSHLFLELIDRDNKYHPHIHDYPHYLVHCYAHILKLIITSETITMAPERITCDKIVAERKRNMPVFQVISRTVQPSGAPKRRSLHTNWWRDFMLRLLVAGLIISVLATLLPRFGLSVLFFLLLPVIVSVITAYPHHYGRKVLLLRACLAFLYFLPCGSIFQSPVYNQAQRSSPHYIAQTLRQCL